MPCKMSVPHLHCLGNSSQTKSGESGRGHTPPPSGARSPNLCLRTVLTPKPPGVTQPDATESNEHVCGNIDSRPQQIAITQKGESLGTKSRKRRKPTQNPNHQKGPRVRTYHLPRLCETGDQADGQAPHEVDGQRSERKARPEQSLHRTAQGEAENRPNESSNANQQKVRHASTSSRAGTRLGRGFAGNPHIKAKSVMIKTERRQPPAPTVITGVMAATLP